LDDGDAILEGRGHVAAWKRIIVDRVAAATTPTLTAKQREYNIVLNFVIIIIIIIITNRRPLRSADVRTCFVPRTHNSFGNRSLYCRLACVDQLATAPTRRELCAFPA